RLVQPTEVFGTVHQYVDAIALCPGRAAPAPGIDRSRLFAPLAGRQEPLVESQLPGNRSLAGRADGLSRLLCDLGRTTKLQHAPAERDRCNREIRPPEGEAREARGHP